MKRPYCYLCNSRSSQFFGKKNGFSIVRCENCGFVYVNSVPSKRQLNQFYHTFDYYNVDAVEKVIRQDATRSLQKIELYKNTGSLLDIGCGRGFFMDEARKRGWEVQGIDYSKNVIDYARTVLHLNAQRSDVFSVTSEKKFDVVTLNQVIEHILNPKDLIQKCYDLLNSKGIIYIATPNIESLAAKVAKEYFDHLIPPLHLGYFSQETLSRLLEESHFRILYLGSWSYPVDLAGIIKRLLKKTQDITKLSKKNEFNTRSRNLSFIKRIKYLLFDKLFCGLFYRVLNFDSFGTILEVIAIKKWS